VRLVLVVLFTLLGFALFSWANISDSMSPIESRPDTVTGMEVLFYFVAILFVAILVWVAIMIIRAAPAARTRPYLFTRFVFVCSPVAITVISIVVGIFTGTFGPFSQTALSLLYYFTLYNVFVWFIAYGYWPVTQDRYRVRNPTDADTESPAFDETSSLFKI